MTTSKPAIPPPLPAVGISTKPTRVRWAIDDILSKDAHRISVLFSCTAGAIDEPAERQLFSEAFSASPQSGSQTAIAHFLPSLRSAGADLGRQENADELLGAPARSRWIQALRTAANETAFACGIEVLAPFEVEVTSPTLQKERLEQMQRLATERRSADRVEHLARAAELLRQWESLKADVPAITPGKLLEQINPADRGQMLDTLLMASAGGPNGQSQTDLWAVSGSSLVQIGCKQDFSKPQMFALSATIGPLRSIRGDNGRLQIGARGGIFIADPANPAAATAYQHAKLTSEFGFTAVTAIGDHLWACHREGGLVGWDVNQPGEPMTVFSPAGFGAEPRHLTPRGVFAAGTKLFRLTPTGPIPSAFAANAPIVALLPMNDQLIVVDENGAVTTLYEPTLETIDQLPAGGRVTAAALLPWLGSSRLLLNRTDGPIECIGLEDQLVTRFGGHQTGMRALTANTAKIAAMSNDRLRLLVWNAWDGRTPAAEIHLTSLTQHRIADLTFA